MAALVRPGRDERGFTLVELGVVVLVIATLVGLALPTYLGTRRRAADRAVQANVRSAFVATRVQYNQGLAYSETPADLLAVEPSLSWTSTPLTAASPARAVFVETFHGGQTVVVVGRTAQGRCFYLKDVMGGQGAEAGTFYDQRVAGSAACPVPDPAGSFWTTAWTTG